MVPMASDALYLGLERERSFFQVGDESRQNSGLVKTCGFHLEAVASPKTPQALACGSSEYPKLKFFSFFVEETIG